MNSIRYIKIVSFAAVFSDISGTAGHSLLPVDLYLRGSRFKFLERYSLSCRSWRLMAFENKLPRRIYEPETWKTRCAYQILIREPVGGHLEAEVQAGRR